MTLTPTQSATLTAAIDRLIPADDWPSASQAGVARFLQELFTTDRVRDRAQFLAGLDGLDAESTVRHGKPFTVLSIDEQDHLLAAVEANDTRAAWQTPPVPFFQLLLNVTAEGYYGDTAQHRVPPSWKMIGYDIGANRP